MENEVQDHLTCIVELKPGEAFTLPQPLIDKIDPGRWIVTVRPCRDSSAVSSSRLHDALLNGYAPKDEGLYDDLGR